MMEIPKFRWTLLFLILFLSGQFSFGDEVKIYISSKRAYRPGSKATVRITLQNQTGKILVPGSLLLQGMEAPLLTFGATKFTYGLMGDPVKAREGTFIQSGFRMWESDIPPHVAMAPMYKREILGKERFISFSLLPPKAKLERIYTFRVPATRQDLKLQVTFRYRYFSQENHLKFYEVENKKPTLLPQKKKEEKKDDPGKKLTPKGPGGRWKLAFESFQYYKEILKPPREGKLVASQKDFETFKKGEGTQKEKIKIYELSFTLSDALKKAGGKAPQKSFYYVPLDCWVLEDARGTTFVTWKKCLFFSGSHSSLAEKLNEHYTIPVKLYDWAKKKDPQGLAKALKGAAFTVYEREEKGGHYSGYCRLPSHRLMEYLVILEKHK